MSQSRDVQRAQLLPHMASGPLRGQSSDALQPYSGGTIAIDAQPGDDLFLAQIFLTMRGTLGWTRDQVAHRLGTTIATIEQLETGRVGALPPWSETLRVIETYGLVVGVDVGPVLDRLQKGAALPPQPVRQQPVVLSNLEPARRPPAVFVPASGSKLPAWHPASLFATKAPAPPQGVKVNKPAVASPLGATLRPTSGSQGSRPPTKILAAHRPIPVAPKTASVPAAPKASPAPDALRVAAPSPHHESVAPLPNDRVAAIAARLSLAADTQERSGRSRRRQATLAAASIAIAIGAIGALLTALPSSTTSAKPDSGFASTMRMSIERIVDGLRWIDVSDPKTRKADRLHHVK